MKHIKCWWFGCFPHPQDPAPVELLECDKCGEIVSSSDLYGDTRHNNFVRWFKYLLLFGWIPKKCKDCGSRRACDCPPF